MWASNCGVIRTPEKLKGVDALLYMIEKMREVSERDCFSQCVKVVVEFPAAVYNPKFSSGALTPLAGVAGACVAMFQNEDENKIFPVYPTVWNGGKKKEKMSELIQQLIGVYSEWEFDDMPTRAGDFEHVIDAVGMAYWLSDKDYFESSNQDLSCERGAKTRKTSLN